MNISDLSVIVHTRPVIVSNARHFNAFTLFQKTYGFRLSREGLADICVRNGPCIALRNIYFYNFDLYGVRLGDQIAINICILIIVDDAGPAVAADTCTYYIFSEVQSSHSLGVNGERFAYICICDRIDSLIHSCDRYSLNFRVRVFGCQQVTVDKCVSSVVINAGPAVVTYTGSSNGRSCLQGADGFRCCGISLAYVGIRLRVDRLGKRLDVDFLGQGRIGSFHADFIRVRCEKTSVNICILPIINDTVPTIVAVSCPLYLLSRFKGSDDLGSHHVGRSHISILKSIDRIVHVFDRRLSLDLFYMLCVLVVDLSNSQIGRIRSV